MRSKKMNASLKQNTLNTYQLVGSGSVLVENQFPIKDENQNFLSNKIEINCENITDLKFNDMLQVDMPLVIELFNCENLKLVSLPSNTNQNCLFLKAEHKIKDLLIIGKMKEFSCIWDTSLNGQLNEDYSFAFEKCAERINPNGNIELLDLAYENAYIGTSFDDQTSIKVDILIVDQSLHANNTTREILHQSYRSIYLHNFPQLELLLISHKTKTIEIKNCKSFVAIVNAPCSLENPLIVQPSQTIQLISQHNYTYQRNLLRYETLAQVGTEFKKLQSNDSIYIESIFIQNCPNFQKISVPSIFVAFSQISSSKEISIDIAQSICLYHCDLELLSFNQCNKLYILDINLSYISRGFPIKKLDFKRVVSETDGFELWINDKVNFVLPEMKGDGLLDHEQNVIPKIVEINPYLCHAKPR
jgi:hypothetical protein